jgi:hypothetical protein
MARRSKRSKRRVVREELAGVDLGDPRRDARALAVADRLVGAPEATLPEAMGDRSMCWASSASNVTSSLERWR